MVEGEPDIDPPNTYEWFECGHGATADDQPVECPDCGGRLHNVSKPRI